MHKHLCQECLRNGKVEPATLSHHVDEYRESFSELDFWYGPLTALCTNCHFKIHGFNQPKELKQTSGQMEKKQFDVRTIIEDAISELMLQGCTKQVALKLLIVQSCSRIEDSTEVGWISF